MAQRLEIYRIFWSLMVCLLLAATMPLWGGFKSFPEVPLIGMVVDHSQLLETFHLRAVFLGLIIVGLFFQWIDRLPILRNQSGASLLPGIGLVLVIVGFAVQFLLNQHRIQAWAYHAVIVAFLLLPISWSRYRFPSTSSERTEEMVEGQEAIALRVTSRLRWIVISVYFFSGVSKLDYSFINSLGHRMVDGLAQLVGLDVKQLPAGLVLAVIWLLPISELLIAIGLIFQRSRRLACGAAVAMHVALLGLVGPLGWQHQLGVSIWNLMFAVQAVLIFGLNRKTAEAEELGQERITPKQSMVEQVSTYVFWAVMVLPVLAWINLTDHWPSWELYAPRTSRASVWIPASHVDRLPADARLFLSESESRGWKHLDVAKWSLRSCAAPIYPEDRFFVGVALALEPSLKDERSIRVQWRGTADRFTGQREEKMLNGFRELKQFASQFRLNARPILISDEHAEDLASESFESDSGR